MLKKRMPKFIVGFGLVFLVAAVSNAAPVTLGFSPEAVNAPVGSSIDINLLVSGLGSGNAPSVGGYDIDVGYNPAVLSPLSVSFGDPSIGDQLDLWGLGSYIEVNEGADYANLVELSYDSPMDLDALQADSFTLATFRFYLWGEGTSSLDLAVNSLTDADGNILFPQLLSGSVNASPVSIPTSILLLGTGLTGLGWIRRTGKTAKGAIDM